MLLELVMCIWVVISGVCLLFVSYLGCLVMCAAMCCSLQVGCCVDLVRLFWLECYLNLAH